MAPSLDKVFDPQIIKVKVQVERHSKKAVSVNLELLQNINMNDGQEMLSECKMLTLLTL